MYSPLVTICTQAYNHEPYIRRCLDGFVSQKTSFEFEVLINDDASTDNTASIIREYEARYPKLIKPVYQTVNQYSQGVNTFTTLLLPKASGRYLCLCESDDYWNDEYKLQKQVDFLETNNDYNICWSRYKILDDTTGEMFSKPHEDVLFQNRDFHTVDVDNLFDPYITLTLTLMVRMDVIRRYSLSDFRHFKDNTIYAMALSNSKGAVLATYSAVYRLHQKGVWSSSAIARQLMQDYYNFNEIYEKIPRARTAHIKDARDKKLVEALNKLHLHKGDPKLYKQLVNEMLKTGSFTNKLKYLLKYALYRLNA